MAPFGSFLPALGVFVTKKDETKNHANQNNLKKLMLSGEMSQNVPKNSRKHVFSHEKNNCKRDCVSK